MGCLKTSLIVTSVLLVGVAYFLYVPIADGISEPWKVQGLMAAFKCIRIMSSLSDTLGVMSSINMTRLTMDTVVRIIGTQNNDPLLEVFDMTFDGVPVRVYKPTQRKSPSPGLVYYHGGGWTIGSIDVYHYLTSYIAKQANLVVVSVGYRLAPEHPFPIPFDDCFTATRHFITNAGKFGVDNRKIAVAGDSSGGNLAAAVSLKLANEQKPNKTRLCFQFLIYPVVQALDFMLPSYEDHDTSTPEILNRFAMGLFWANYLGLSPDRAAELIRNEHISPKLKKSKYSHYVDAKQLPIKYHKSIPRKDSKIGNVTLSAEIEKDILNPYCAPLMASDLSKVAPAMILTSEYDVLRDEGLLYGKRLIEAGVDVVQLHVNDGYHVFMMAPTNFQIGVASSEKFFQYAKQKFDGCV